jgi:hypothetical protein
VAIIFLSKREAVARESLLHVLIPIKVQQDGAMTKVPNREKSLQIKSTVPKKVFQGLCRLVVWTAVSDRQDV